jgi:hypothetical protein
VVALGRLPGPRMGRRVEQERVLGGRRLIVDADHLPERVELVERVAGAARLSVQEDVGLDRIVCDERVPGERRLGEGLSGRVGAHLHRVKARPHAALAGGDLSDDIDPSGAAAHQAYGLGEGEDDVSHEMERAEGARPDHGDRVGRGLAALSREKGDRASVHAEELLFHRGQRRALCR